ncbi:hypothetical protein ABZX60_16655 [Streptomyces olivaceus]|uniref:hypothetical protein n=1 Tax=Streptomyces TaxID=1883 RepID=UPI0021D7EA2C|nr:hypothetical protein [Streptomyces sp. A13(2022)]MCU8595167.1 hypothetical protein [Streptomyces sp. A13(2022)]
MFETATEFVSAYLMSKATTMLDRAGADADSLFDRKLAEFYDWARERLAGLGAQGERSLRMLERAPEGVDERAQLGEELARAIDGDQLAQDQLRMLLAKLEQLRPSGATVRGSVRSGELGGGQVGVLIEGTAAAGDQIEGTAVADRVLSTGTNAGVVYRPGGVPTNR